MKIIKKYVIQILTLLLLFCTISIKAEAAEFESNNQSKTEVGITFTEEPNPGEEGTNSGGEKPNLSDEDEKEQGAFPATGERRLSIPAYIGLFILLFMIIVFAIKKLKELDKKNS